MRFSGHETFPIRDGWLHKGLSLLVDATDRLHHEFAADYLGVGHNMAKSIRHWLLATGLAKPDPDTRGRIVPTEFGELIHQHDLYFEDTGTWWMLHVNLVKHGYATTWNWFFNQYNLERFERAMVVENLRQFIQIKRETTPSISTLERDVACLLSSYARHIPSETADPEESRDCPFRELGLMDYFRTSGSYQLHLDAKDIHPCILGYCIASAFEDAGLGGIELSRLLRDPSGPGRAFSLSNEALHEMLIQVDTEHKDFRLEGLAGQRALSLPDYDSHAWAEKYYSSVRGRKGQ